MPRTLTDHAHDRARHVNERANHPQNRPPRQRTGGPPTDRHARHFSARTDRAHDRPTVGARVDRPHDRPRPQGTCGSPTGQPDTSARGRIAHTTIRPVSARAHRAYDRPTRQRTCASPTRPPDTSARRRVAPVPADYPPATVGRPARPATSRVQSRTPLPIDLGQVRRNPGAAGPARQPTRDAGHTAPHHPAAPLRRKLGRQQITLAHPATRTQSSADHPPARSGPTKPTRRRRAGRIQTTPGATIATPDWSEQIRRARTANPAATGRAGRPGDHAGRAPIRRVRR